MAKVCDVFPGPSQQQDCMISTTTPALPPPRRPRVREVSSRFMSPVVSSSSSGDLHVLSSKHNTTSAAPTHQQRSQSAQRRDAQLRESFSYADENRLETARSLDTPWGSLNKQVVSLQKKHQYGDGQQLRTLCGNKVPIRSGNVARLRPDTPIVHSRDRMNYKFQKSPRSSTDMVASAGSTAAAKLVQLSGMNNDGFTEVQASKCVRSLDLVSRSSLDSTSNDSFEHKTFTISDQESSCNSPAHNSKMRPLTDFRSSMPETDLLPTISSKFLAHNRDTPKASAFPCYRSLNSLLPSSEQQQSFPGMSKSSYKPSSNGVCLPPHPPTAKLGVEGRKGTKKFNQQEQEHSLRMLNNRYLHWRYANAKAEASMSAQSIAVERSFHGVTAKISDLHDSVNKKRCELTQLKTEMTLSSILEAQIPYLDNWSTLEDEYSSSLAGAIKALQDTSLRLPIVGNVKADTEELGRALNSASNVMELMYSHVETLLPKGEEMDALTSELAEVVKSERVMIEECGDLLSRTHSLQLIECSLRAQLLQLKLSSHPAKDK